MEYRTAFTRARIRGVTGAGASVKAVVMLVAAVLIAASVAGCASAPSDNVIIADARTTIIRFVERDPGLQEWVDHAHGYAVFPGVGKGGLGLGGSYGHGVVFERGEPIGTTRIVQATIGAQIGVQKFSQIIFFQDDAAMRTFQRGNYEMSAQATAIIANTGAAATTSYEKGVAVFLMGRGGLMAEASVGGQKFEYEPL